MKNLILGITLALSSFAFNASASTTKAMAETKVQEDVSIEKTIIELFAKEAAKPNSELSNYLSALKSHPDNQDYYIEDTISESDIVRLDSGASGGSFGINYLILIRAGYKSNTFQIGYLKANAFGLMDEVGITVQITEPANVVIE